MCPARSVTGSIWWYKMSIVFNADWTMWRQLVEKDISVWAVTYKSVHLSRRSLVSTPAKASHRIKENGVQRVQRQPLCHHTGDATKSLLIKIKYKVQANIFGGKEFLKPYPTSTESNSAFTKIPTGSIWLSKVLKSTDSILLFSIPNFHSLRSESHSLSAPV